MKAVQNSPQIGHSEHPYPLIHNLMKTGFGSSPTVLKQPPKIMLYYGNLESVHGLILCWYAISQK